jgi:hypothetical protein
MRFFILNTSKDVFKMQKDNHRRFMREQLPVGTNIFFYTLKGRSYMSAVCCLLSAVCCLLSAVFFIIS